MFQIRDILVRILGSLPLTNGSGTCSSSQWTSKKSPLKFLFFIFWRYIYIIRPERWYGYVDTSSTHWSVQLWLAAFSNINCGSFVHSQSVVGTPYLHYAYVGIVSTVNARFFLRHGLTGNVSIDLRRFLTFIYFPTWLQTPGAKWDREPTRGSPTFSPGESNHLIIPLMCISLIWRWSELPPVYLFPSGFWF